MLEPKFNLHITAFCISEKMERAIKLFLKTRKVQFESQSLELLPEDVEAAKEPKA